MAFPPAQIWPLIFLAVALLIHAAHVASSARVAFLVTWLTFAALWLWVAAWVLDVTMAGWPVLAAYLALYPATAVWCLRRVDRHHALGTWPTAVTAPIIFLGLECVRGIIIFDGYPWYFIGQPLIDAAVLAQPADILGIWWGSVLVAAVAGLAVDICGSHRKRSGRSGLVVAALMICAVPYGVWRLGQTEVLRPGPNVLAVQTNLPQDNKIGWSPQAWRGDVQEFLELTGKAIDSSGAIDLVVWPETMVPGLGFDPSTRESLLEAGPGFAYLHESADMIRQLAQVLDRPVLVGSSSWLSLSQRTVEGAVRIEPGTRYNSAVLVSPKGDVQRYDKVVLTPFGERMPYLEHWPWLEDRLMAIGAGGMQFNLDAAQTVEVLDMSHGGGSIVLGTPICFEDTVPGLVRQMVYGRGGKGVDVLINISNDGWFGRHDAVRTAHSQAARWRCIENRVPMLRVVNTGDTSWFDSSGRIVAIAPSREATWLLCSPQLDDRSTIFGTVIGNGLAWLALLGLVFMLAWTFRPETEHCTDEATA